MNLTKLADSFKRRESSEHLKLLAKRAAGLYISKEANTLTDAVRKSLKNENLNEDQMRRVVEMTNQATWKEMFQDDRQVNFEPANANEVVESFSESPVETSPMSLDYASDPETPKPEVDLEKEFGMTEPREDYDRLNPDSEKQEEVAKAAAALDAARHAVGVMNSDIPELADRFFNQVKHAHLFDGHSFSKIAKAVGAVTNTSFATSIMKTAASHLSEQGHRFDLNREKLAAKESVVINTDHELLDTVTKLEKVARALAYAQKAHREAEVEYKNALAKLKGE